MLNSVKQFENISFDRPTIILEILLKNQKIGIDYNLEPQREKENKVKELRF